MGLPSFSKEGTEGWYRDRKVAPLLCTTPKPPPLKRRGLYRFKDYPAVSAQD